ncbi:toll/interleukin-1 receptor domain-containing protein [Streptomyces sp. NPDC088816]|uniref:toll/interleukin-1 receptor domain-containing protein n=1 Tax=Streptomyces sp. NPDC088816 TaxID=3365906 RepID=UPI0037F2EADF
MKIFISHGGEGTDPCVDEALSLIVPELEQRGYDVFTDVEKLRGGDSWNEVLYEEMYLCDAAIVLLGPQTIATSHWVRLESDVLMGRHMVRSLRTVLPGILGTENTGSARDRGFGALLKVQAILCRRKLRPLPADGGVTQFVDWVVAEFASVAEPVDDRPFHDWVKRVSSFLRTSRERNPDTITEAAAFLQCSRGELVHVRAKVGAELFLAHLMLKAAAAAVTGQDTQASLPQAVAALRAGLAGSQLQQLSEELLPSWVDPDTAAHFVQDMTSEAAERRPIVLFQAWDEWTARQHVLRAVDNKPGSFRLGQLPPLDELPQDEGTSVKELLDACLAALRRVFDVPPRMPLNERTVRRGRLPQYLVINAADYPLQDVAQVVNTLHGMFGWLVVIVLVPKDVPGMNELHGLGLTRAASVGLPPEQEQRAYGLKLSLESVVQPAG